MSLFNTEFPEADLAYRNIRRAERRTEAGIKQALETLWERYEPYADTAFPQKFAREPDSRFWEMYLTVQILHQGKNVIPRSELPKKKRNAGPDIRINQDERTIWIEAVTPGPGDLANPDRVPRVIPLREGIGAQIAPRTPVELRISNALSQKRDAFHRYMKTGLVSENDFCVVAVSGNQFSTQSGTIGLPRAVTVVYPLGEEHVTFNRETFEEVDSSYQYSEHISRSNATPIPRYAFLDPRFSNISGLIWSRRTIGNFTIYEQDFVFIHNVTAQNPFPVGWFPWDQEYVIRSVGNEYELVRINQH